MASSSSSEVKNLMQNLSVQVPVKYPGKLSKQAGGGKRFVSVFCVFRGVNLDQQKHPGVLVGRFSWDMIANSPKKIRSISFTSVLLVRIFVVFLGLNDIFPGKQKVPK